MEPIIVYIAIFNVLILVYAFTTKKGLYDITPEEEWAHELNEFDKNVEAIDKVNLNNYKMNSDHLYHN